MKNKTSGQPSHSVRHPNGHWHPEDGLDVDHDIAELRRQDMAQRVREAAKPADQGPKPAP